MSLKRRYKLKEKCYIAIDLKSFYASVECRERGLDPLTTNLVVADASRTTKTICLAVTPSLKEYGIPGRPRLFEVIQKIKEENAKRIRKAPGQKFTAKSFDSTNLKKNPSLEIDFIAAPPQMAHYMEWSTKIYHIYLNYAAKEDIHVYSIDEVFIDITPYLKVSGLSPAEFTKKIILDVEKTTGITATAGIGTNLYLCKIALDIMAKRVKPDEDGVRIAQLDEISYRTLLWDHRPLTDFWRVGKGYTKKLEENGLFTMGDIARCSMGKLNEYHNENLLYKLFGINAELLIDHAWGWEPCTIADVKSYKPESNSICSGQVLHSPYSFEKARIVVMEMTDLLVLDLVDKGLVTNQMVLTVGYDTENLNDDKKVLEYTGEVIVDQYGRSIPKHAHGTANLIKMTSSTKIITEAVVELYDRIVNPKLWVRRISLTANHVVDEKLVIYEEQYEQMSLFVDYDFKNQQRKEEQKVLEREKRIQKTVLNIKKKYGKNAIIKGMNLQDGATTLERNSQIGGHKA